MPDESAMEHAWDQIHTLPFLIRRMEFLNSTVDRLFGRPRPPGIKRAIRQIAATPEALRDDIALYEAAILDQLVTDARPEAADFRNALQMWNEEEKRLEQQRQLGPEEWR